MCLEAEGNDTSLVGLVESSELLGELGLGDIWSAGVKDVDNELASGQETVGNELACADGYWGVGLTDERWKVSSAKVGPSNRNWCHPSHSSPRSTALFSLVQVPQTIDAVLTMLGGVGLLSVLLDGGDVGEGCGLVMISHARSLLFPRIRFVNQWIRSKFVVKSQNEVNLTFTDRSNEMGGHQ